MSYPLAMARAFRGEPWRCLVVETTSRALFLAAPEHAAAVEAGECEPIAFPIEDVFDFDQAMFGELQKQWERDGRTDDVLWEAAERFGTGRAAA